MPSKKAIQAAEAAMPGWTAVKETAATKAAKAKAVKPIVDAVAADIATLQARHFGPAEAGRIAPQAPAPQDETELVRMKTQGGGPGAPKSLVALTRKGKITGMQG